MKKLSIVIVSYNNLKVLNDCLDSVFENNDLGEDLQVIVVEQSLNNDIYNWVKEKYEKVDLVRAENRGFGAGNNIGVRLAEAPYLLLLNPDTILIEPVGKYAINKFENDSRIGLFGVQLLDAERHKSSSFENIIPFGIVAKLRYAVCNRLNKFWESKMFIQGADMFVRTDLFRQVDGFNEEVFMYFEEADICTLIRKAGYRVKYFSSKRIVHLQGACSSDKYVEIYGRQLKAFSKFCEKHRIDMKKALKKEYRYQNFKKRMMQIMRKTDSDAYIVAQQKMNVLGTYLF